METITTREVLHLNSMEIVDRVDKNFAIVLDQMDRMEEDSMARMALPDLAILRRMAGQVQIDFLQTGNRDLHLSKELVSNTIAKFATKVC
jgi:hypothetical protein